MAAMSTMPRCVSLCYVRTSVFYIVLRQSLPVVSKSGCLEWFRSASSAVYTNTILQLEIAGTFMFMRVVCVVFVSVFYVPQRAETNRLQLSAWATQGLGVTASTVHQSQLDGANCSVSVMVLLHQATLSRSQAIPRSLLHI